MQPILGSSILADLAHGDLLLAFDFDGTLAPIVNRPEDAAMRSRTRHLLAEVARVYPCAVISGRREEDLLGLLGGVTVWYVVGNRFLETPEAAARRTAQVSRWRPELETELARLRGVRIEDKGTSLALHYRGAPEHDRTRDAILAAARLLDRVRVVPGKEVINLLPQGGPDKGLAVERLRTQLGCREVLYAGDDRSDEDVFALPHVHGVRVGLPEGEKTTARFLLQEQDDVDELLERLIDVRAKPARRPEASPASSRRTPPTWS